MRFIVAVLFLLTCVESIQARITWRFTRWVQVNDPRITHVMAGQPQYASRQMVVNSTYPTTWAQQQYYRPTMPSRVIYAGVYTQRCGSGG